MLSTLRTTIVSFLEKRKDKPRYESIKITLIYIIVGLLWITFSDSTLRLLTTSTAVFMKISAFKGYFYVFITAYMLYRLIFGLSKHLFLAKNKLTTSYKELQDFSKQLMESEEKSRALLHAIPDVLFVIDPEGFFLDCETNDDSKLLFPIDQFIGKQILETLPLEVANLAQESIKRLFLGEPLVSFEYELKISERIQFYEIRMVKKSDREILAILRDITIRRAMEQQLEYLSLHDALTGLYNRRFYEKELLHLDVLENLPLTIILGDVNGLKLINDSFGHDTGDKLIQKTADLLSKTCRPKDMIARLGGDEFVILMPNTTEQEAEQLVQKLKKTALQEKIQNVSISISYGHCTKSNALEKIEDIFTQAENYMYRRKLLESTHMRGRTIEAMLHTLSEKSQIEKQHSKRVSKLCEIMGDLLGFSDNRLSQLKVAGLMHDIGKIALADFVLQKEPPLSEMDIKELQRHSEIGYRILNTVSEMSEISTFVLYHHEHWDGSGYPKGIRGLEIPLESRIISLMDAFDFMITSRDYHEALAINEAVLELEKNANTQFDPELFLYFKENLSLFEHCLSQ